MNQVNTKICSFCKQEKGLQEYHKSKIHKYGVYTRCKDCSSIIRKLDRLENPERYRLNELRYRSLNREKRRESDRKSSKKNVARRNANNSNRRTMKVMALVPWRDKEKVLGFYKETKRLELETGIKHHVDHIYPLISEWVCGLHCEFNLRVIPWRENLKKGNRRVHEIND